MRLKFNSTQSNSIRNSSGVIDVHSEVLALKGDFKSKQQWLLKEVAILKKEISQGASPTNDARSKVRVLKPKGFSGNQNAKELENFLWDMEQFYKAAHVLEIEMVSITTMYLSSDGKLLWRTQFKNDKESRRPQITMWEILKKEIKKQFLPSNKPRMARESLKRLTDKCREGIFQGT